MSQRAQLICGWGGILFCVLFGLGAIFISQFVPPISPASSAEAVAVRFAQDQFQIRAGMLLIILSSMLYVPLTAGLSAEIGKQEGQSRAISQIQFGSGVCVAIFVLIPALIWAVASFRADRAPELILLLNDLGWIMLLLPFSPAFFQVLTIAYAVFVSDESNPALPRWFGYFSVWAAVLFLPGILITFFKTGPFAWDGIIGFWLPVGVFFTWILAAALMVRSGAANWPTDR